MELESRVVLVTGGARRIGRAIAERLARSGCRIAVHYRRSAAGARETVEACRSGGADADAFEADLGDASACGGLVRRVLERFGGLDVLINNASVFERMTLDEFDYSSWERTLRVNVTGPMALAFEARGALRAAKGRVVNLCDAAVSRPWADHLAYVTSKGALETLTGALARAFAPEVNVVGVAPGVAEWPEGYDAVTRARLTSGIPLGRAGTAAEVAALVHFLLAEGDYITGTVIAIDGGRRIA